MFADKWGRVGRSEEVVAGRWLADQFGEETTILHDSYAYIPSKFKDAFVVIPAHTFPVVNHFEPDMIVLRNARFKRFQYLNDAERARVGKNTFMISIISICLSVKICLRTMNGSRILRV